jgi:hypothetical protein
MGWSIGWDGHWRRDIGYGVPAFCDHPKCDRVIDRGLAFVCGGEPYGGEVGCGLYFCEDHRVGRRRDATVCSRCANYRPPYAAKPDHPRWLRHKLTDDSWAEWRNENREEVGRIEQALAESAHGPDPRAA